jgi:hypothetical protein
VLAKNHNISHAQILQMSTDGLLRGDMVHVGFGKPETSFFGGKTAFASTIFLNWRKVSLEGLMAQVHSAGREDCLTETLILMSMRTKTKRWPIKRTAVRVGHTQSNISAPRATATTISSGYP